MPYHRLALAAALAISSTNSALAQSADDNPSELLLELNTVQEVNGACRLTFLVQNETGSDIEKAAFETVIFDSSGRVVTLSLFDFRDLPADRPRVRQFGLPDLNCDSIGRVLINGANSCVVDGSESDICSTGLNLTSRIDVELLG